MEGRVPVLTRMSGQATTWAKSLNTMLSESFILNAYLDKFYDINKNYDSRAFHDSLDR